MKKRLGQDYSAAGSYERQGHADISKFPQKVVHTLIEQQKRLELSSTNRAEVQRFLSHNNIAIQCKVVSVIRGAVRVRPWLQKLNTFLGFPDLSASRYFCLNLRSHPFYSTVVLNLPSSSQI